MTSTLKIIPLPSGAFNVYCGELSATELPWEQMLGMVAQLTSPRDKPLLGLLKTNTERNRQAEMPDIIRFVQPKLFEDEDIH